MLGERSPVDLLAGAHLADLLLQREHVVLRVVEDHRVHSTAGAKIPLVAVQPLGALSGQVVPLGLGLAGDRPG